jgi:hypothetical protein
VDADFAKKQDFSYGQTYAPYVTDQTTHKTLDGDWNKFPMPTKQSPPSMQANDLYSRAALASNASALAQLGFDPSITILDKDRPRDKVQVNVLGEYARAKPTSKFKDATGKPYEQIYVNADYPDVAMHESLHRGIAKLKDTPYWKPEYNQLMGLGGDDELLVRHLMASKFGNPEVRAGKTPHPEIQEAADKFAKGERAAKLKGIIDALEGDASQYIAAKRPRGPR